MSENKLDYGIEYFCNLNEHAEELAKRLVSRCTSINPRFFPNDRTELFAEAIKRYLEDMKKLAPHFSESDELIQLYTKIESQASEMAMKTLHRQTSMNPRIFPKDRIEIFIDRYGSNLTSLLTGIVSRMHTRPADAPQYDSKIISEEQAKETEDSAIISTVEQINKSYASECPDAVAGLMRKLIEISIIKVFLARQEGDRVKKNDGSGDFQGLKDLLGVLQESNVKVENKHIRHLKKSKKFGDIGMHNPFSTWTMDDIDSYQVEYVTIIYQLFKELKSGE